MLVRALCSLVLALLPATGILAPARARELTCWDLFWSWEEAQTALVMTYNGVSNTLDPDGNGIACEEMTDVHGFAPAWWTDRIPRGLTWAEVRSIKDADTLNVVVGGAPMELQLYRADAPEKYNDATCGAVEAANALESLLDESDQGWIVWIEKDVTKRDVHGRSLGYAWIEFGGEPLLINEALVRSGWAADVDYGDELYDLPMTLAANFAYEFRLGTWGMCASGPYP